MNKLHVSAKNELLLKVQIDVILIVNNIYFKLFRLLNKFSNLDLQMMSLYKNCIFLELWTKSSVSV